MKIKEYIKNRSQFIINVFLMFLITLSLGFNYLLFESNILLNDKINKIEKENKQYQKVIIRNHFMNKKNYQLHKEHFNNYHKT